VGPVADLPGDPAHCRACRLCESRTQVVLPTAPRNGQGLWVVGEAPGAEEDRCGEGFVGRAGRTLERLLGEQRILPGTYGKTNLCRCRPPGNRKPTAAEIAACQVHLQALLAQPGIRVVLAVGASASAAFYPGCGSLSRLMEVAAARQYVPQVPWATHLVVIPCPHTSPLTYHRRAPSGEPWADIIRRQIAVAVARQRAVEAQSLPVPDSCAGANAAPAPSFVPRPRRFSGEPS
jgi:uracil-DNA glycosylase family 4